MPGTALVLENAALRQSIITERALRPIAHLERPDEQTARFREMIAQIG